MSSHCGLRVRRRATNSVDLNALTVLLGIVTAALAILGTLFGWFGKLWTFLARLFRSDAVASKLPKRTLILHAPTRERDLWWHMGSVGKKPAMQLVGSIRVTNIAGHTIFPMHVKLNKPKVTGPIDIVVDHQIVNPRIGIPRETVRELTFALFIEPAPCEIGRPFRANIAVVDQFGNEHWLKRLTFVYQ
jgi:hypothetical protein